MRLSSTLCRARGCRYLRKEARGRRKMKVCVITREIPGNMASCPVDEVKA